MKLTDYLTKVQSTNERDRMADEHQQGLHKCYHAPVDVQEAALIGYHKFIAGYDSRTADITRLCEIVKLLQEQRNGLLVDDSGCQKSYHLRQIEELDQLIEGIEK